ncbi:MAG: response regulator, partial [Proteobacteria bacterium]|nr:response regulator [Pseudomonadota bacterium]
FGGGPRDLESALARGGRLDPGRRYGAIRVADSGAGMDQATVEQIFEPFFTTKEGGHGTGLGLAVVHGIVMAYDGAYLVRSRVGTGSEFSLYLPLDETISEAATETDGTASLRGDESVLIVDDEVDLTDMLSIGLERLGYDVTCCNDPFEALHAFEQDPGAWDVVVTDHMMPAMRGVALIERLKTISPGVATLLCTGFSDGATEEAARRAGADAFLMKPLEAHRIAQQMRALLDQRASTTVGAPAG